MLEHYKYLISQNEKKLISIQEDIEELKKFEARSEKANKKYLDAIPQEITEAMTKDKLSMSVFHDAEDNFRLKVYVRRVIRPPFIDNKFVPHVQKTYNFSLEEQTTESKLTNLPFFFVDGGFYPDEKGEIFKYVSEYKRLRQARIDLEVSQMQAESEIKAYKQSALRFAELFFKFMRGTNLSLQLVYVSPNVVNANISNEEKSIIIKIDFNSYAAREMQGVTVYHDSFQIDFCYYMQGKGYYCEDLFIFLANEFPQLKVGFYDDMPSLTDITNTK